MLGAHIRTAAPWAAAATSSRAFTSTPTGTGATAFVANRLWEYANTGAGAAPP